jgi:hypothetical protein
MVPCGIFNNLLSYLVGTKLDDYSGPLNARFTHVLNWPTHTKKSPIYTRTR